MEIRMMKLGELTPYEKNPRKNDEAVPFVAASIREFGFKIPIVIDANNVIVCGHTRFKAAKELGMTEVPCIVADDLTEEQVKAFRLADNKVAEKAEWDFDLLGDEMLDIPDIDMGEFGFFTDEFEIEEPSADELDSDKENTGHVIVSINIPNVARWNMIENEIKRIANEVEATVTVKME